MNHLDILKKRYATKAMNGVKVPQEKIDNVLEAIRLAPTSSGLQPFEVFVITDKQVKSNIREIAWNQSQVTDCSHLLVFAAWDHYTEDRINHMFDLTNDIRGFKNEGWENYRKQLLSNYPKKDPKENFEHAARQTYIAFMSAITQAAAEGLDSTPMEGFDSGALDALLNLKEKGLKSTLLLPIGFRDAEKDWLVNLVKVRKPMEELVNYI